MLAFETGRQFIFIGGMQGLSYALLALGVILVYRSSRVINFAVGATGVLASQVMAQLAIRYDVAFWLAFVLAVAVGALFLAIAELIVVRRLFNAPRVVLLVATIGLAQLAEALIFVLPEASADERKNRFPTAVGRDFEWFGVRVEGGELVLFLASLAAVVALGSWLRYSAWGRAIRASASQPDRARLAGINPGTVSTVVWGLTGAFAGMVATFQEADGQAFLSASPGTSLMTRVLVVAVCASFVSFPRAVFAGIGVGIVEALMRVNYPSDLGRIEAFLLIVAIVGVYLTTRSASSDERESFSFAPRIRPIPPALKDIWWVRNHTRIIGAAAVTVAVIVPLIVTTNSRTGRYSDIMLMALAALSLVILVGWSGQISLGQGAFAGFGAFTTAALVNGHDLGLGAAGIDWTLPLPELHFFWAIVWATALTAVVAVIVGLGAIRVRGLLLAVITLAFAVSAEKFFFRRPFLSGGSQSSVFMERSSAGPIDLTPQRTYYYLALAALFIAMVFVARIRNSGIGRRIVATRENPEAASAATVSPVRTNLLAFALSGAVAGFAGALLGGRAVTVTFASFSVETSFEILAAAVIGGVGSVAGPILGALWVFGIPAFWSDSTIAPLLTSSLGILILLMYVPGGFVQLWFLARDTFFAWYAERLPEPVRLKVVIPDRDPVPDAPSDIALRASNIRVNFGSRAAVDGVNLVVGHREVVGLIGTNGAGKSTFMNAVCGLVPARGTVELYGEDISRLPSHRRHARHLGRTFQSATLFPDLTVRETVQVALEARLPTRFLPVALGLPSGRSRERRQAAVADELIDFLGLGDYANAFVAELSTGTRRIVELTCLVAGGNRLLCLDEPTAGVAQREAEALVPLLLGIRRELDASVLIIEHDMPMIMGISDRIYCLEAGQVIAEGEPKAVRDDPLVVASYLGTDVRAIERSDTQGRS